MERSSTGTSDAWLFIKNINDEEAPGTYPENNNLKSTDEMEDSDGSISVISECEMLKNHSDIEPEKSQITEELGIEENFEGKNEAKNKQQDDDEIEKDPDILTPPSTPNNFNDDQQELQMNVLNKYEENSLKELDSNETGKYHNGSHGVMLLIGMSLIIAVLYTNVSSLKNELSKTVTIYEQRIVRLEQENQILRAQLDELMRTLKETNSVESFISNEKASSMSAPQSFQTEPKDNDEIQPKPPITKNVWLGDTENEEVVKILDKKYNSLPDYCYFTDENDLFYDYNMQNCEKKKQKLEERIQKFNQKRDKYEKENEFVQDKYNADDIWKSKDEKYNKFMSKATEEIIQSLNAEIEKIKNDRLQNPMANIENDDKKTTKEKQAAQNNKQTTNRDKKKYKATEKQTLLKDDKSKNKSPSKRRDKDSSFGDWNERRTNGREHARLRNEDEQNWYLKRKNEREINRLETLRNFE